MQNADEQIVETHIEIDRSEAEKYEFTRESSVFSILFFQLNMSNLRKVLNGSLQNRVHVLWT